MILDPGSPSPCVDRAPTHYPSCSALSTPPYLLPTHSLHPPHPTHTLSSNPLPLPSPSLHPTNNFPTLTATSLNPDTLSIGSDSESIAYTLTTPSSLTSRGRLLLKNQQVMCPGLFPRLELAQTTKEGQTKEKMTIQQKQKVGLLTVDCFYY